MNNNSSKGRLCSGSDLNSLQEASKSLNKQDLVNRLERRTKFLDKQIKLHENRGMKDHEIAQLVNKLLVLARTHYDKECLRQLISEAVVKAINKS